MLTERFQVALTCCLAELHLMFSDVTSRVIPLLSHVLLRCQFSASGQLEFYYGGKL